MESTFINELLLSVMDAFQELYESSRGISELEKRLNTGKANLTDAESYAEEISRLLNRAYSRVLGAADLPDGNVYWETCKALIEKPLTEAYNKVAEATVKALDAENAKNGIGLKAQAGKLDADKLRGIADVANKAESFEKAAAAIVEPVHSVTRSAVVDTVHATADMQDAAGLEVKIVRTTRGSNPCSWCKEMAGTYDYASVKRTGHNVWRRHERCTCRIEYVSKKTRHTVDNYRSAADAARAKIAERKQLGAGSDSTPEKIAARKALAGVDEAERARKKLLRDHPEIKVDWQEINSMSYKEKFTGLSDNETLNNNLYKSAKEILKHRDRSMQEDLYLLDAESGEILCKHTTSTKEQGVEYTGSVKKVVNANKGKLISIHNHPQGMPPSAADINSQFVNGYKKGVVVTHDGRVFVYEIEGGFKVVRSQKMNFYIADYKKAGYNESDAQMKALQRLVAEHGFSIKEVLA